MQIAAKFSLTAVLLLLIAGGERREKESARRAMILAVSIGPHSSAGGWPTRDFHEHDKGFQNISVTHDFFSSNDL
jgi:hypothetical protein